MKTPNKVEISALIVDDEEDIGAMLMRFLDREGITTVYADRIKKAKGVIENESFDFYLLDLNLPDGTGFDLIPTIRNQSHSAKIIVISAYDGVAEMERARDLEIDRFIRKPFTKKEVLETIAELR
ncbi:MAG: response regulator [Cyclobacteriaceae bacterium]